MGPTFIEILRRRAEATPHRPALEFEVSETEIRTLDYAALDRGARAVAAQIQQRASRGDRVLLLHQPGPDYVTAFFGCLYSGTIAVPVYPPLGTHGLERVRAIAADSGAMLALVDTATLAAIDDRGNRLDLGSSLEWATTDDAATAPEDWQEPELSPDDLAFLQYTSGSTGTPKGVMLSHANLVHNSETIGRSLRLDENSRGVSWLPPYHDMGLIGGILQPVHTGFPCTLLSPLTFLHQPLRWLRALSRTRATITAAPDFAYAEALRRTKPEEREELDLSALRHALVGAEPVRRATMDAFAEAFRTAGFRRSAFYPCYGLAEATLFVTGRADPAAEPAVLRVRRPDLDEGRAGMAAPGEPAAELTGCGWAHHEDLTLIVDPATGEPLPPGAVGEVWVSGPTVARGYWNRPEQTAAAFGAVAEGHPGRVFLRTGDLGFRHEAELYVTGRIKDLIIVRGRNLYPPDLEMTAERAHPLLHPGRSAAIAVDNGASEQVVLVHEVVRTFRNEDGPLVVRAVREAVMAEHGIALADVVLVRVGKIPRTSSGKVRRAECRARWLAGTLEPVAAAERTGPATTVPAELTELVAAALDTDPAALVADAPLVSQGLDSLRAVRLKAALFDTRGVDVPLARFLDGLTPLDLAALPAHEPARPPVTAQPGPAVVTPEQERMWLLDQMGAGDAYHVVGGLRLHGPLDRALLERCLTGLFDEVPLLRSVFRRGPDDTLGLSVLPTVEVFRLPFRNLSAHGEDRVAEELRALAAEPFDLGTGPLVRLLLLQRSPQEWVLGIAAHHAVLDGWSMGLLLQRLGDAYRDGGTVEPRPSAIPPLVPWTEKSLASWRERLDGAPALELHTDRPVPATPTWHGASLPVRIPADLVVRLQTVAAERGATPFMVLLAAFGALLGRWSGQDDLVVGTVAAGRDQPGTETAIGMLADILPLRVRTGSAGFGAVIDDVRAQRLAAYDPERPPFDEIVRATTERPADGRAPLVRALLALQNLPINPWEARGVRAEPFELPSPGAQFELALHLVPTSDGSLTGHAVYAVDLFEEQTITALLSGLPVLLDAALTDPSASVADLPTLAPAEAERIARTVADGGPAAHGGMLVHQLVERVARSAPEATAVAWDGGSLSYGDLDARARGLAARLRELGVTPDQPVAVCLPRSPELVIAIYAVLLAGGAYLPLDTSHPLARLTRQIGIARARILIGSAPGLTPPEGTVLVGPEETGTGLFTDAEVLPGHLANVLFTSGSTGEPKGVMTTHDALANQLVWYQRTLGLDAGEAVLLKTPASFDVATLEMLAPLVAGATVVLARPDGHRDTSYLAHLIARHSVTICHFVPSMLQIFLEEPDAVHAARTLRQVGSVGEELAPALAERFAEVLPGVRLHNLYGPTEAAIEAAAQEIGPAETVLSRVPIGRAIAGTRLYVLDSSGGIAPPLAPGELHIGGVAPARGYLGRPALTADRFVPDPYGSGTRLYRTGDRARMRPDGTFEYLGRLDRQLKIRGQRVEPGEIEVVLNRHPLVRASVVEARPDTSGRLRLLAWVVPAGTEFPSPGTLRAHLEQVVPAGLVPDTVTVLSEFPVSPHGKLDRSALPDPAPRPAASEQAVSPRNPVEGKMARIWSEVLGVPELSVTADFFQLGGHSLMATRVAMRVRYAFGVTLSAGELLSGTLTIERLAALVQSRQLAEAGDGEVDDVLGWLSGLSDDEVAELLAKEPGGEGMP
ncbi:amino acid adenylation domain-containing protein [Streptomyces sp. MCA2]|uniref:non-ribosomal peptide synthetase n=1 Tax=Streptomyces sp. MCA2 TaxID=2944805 RepID=UPI002021D59D|nr:non-ribosomal peptide synthetase [Streptomyces sp. MCA2]MCL7491262.1 amino acid adenylation domain-containing protein [Streptomyces sp. MCA2]